MTARIEIPERLWLSVAERLAAVAALGALIYVFSIGRGRGVMDDRVAPHVLFAFGASICLVLSAIVRQRVRALAIGSQLIALLLLALSIASLRQGR
jgi:hypothetical protein